MTDEPFDAIGVILLPCRKPGKFKARRIGIRGDKIEILDTLTEDRHLMAAHRVAATSFELLATELVRAKFELAQPRQLTLKFAND